jgi:nucleoside-diphosphate-sugar epimerase
VRNGKTKLVMVVGGAGFLGSHLCDYLLGEGNRVICVDNFQTGRQDNLRHLKRDPRFDLVQADIAEALPASLAPERLHLSAIYNLACAASPRHYQADPEHTMLTCVLGTRSLLRLAEATGARFLQASTSEIYGDPEAHPQREDYWGHVNATGPRACYDEGKRAAETLAFDFARARRAEVRVARIFNTYGPRMRADDGRVVSNVICQALAGEDITIYGDGSQTRSFCYVDDLVDGADGARPRRARSGSHRLALAHRAPAAAGGRSPPPPPRHLPREGAAGLVAARAAADGARGDGRLVPARGRSGAASASRAPCAARHGQPTGLSGGAPAPSIPYRSVAVPDEAAVRGPAG